MCSHCDTLKLAIRKGQKLAAGGAENAFSKSIEVFVEKLEAELSALESQPDHDGKPP